MKRWLVLAGLTIAIGTSVFWIIATSWETKISREVHNSRKSTTFQENQKKSYNPTLIGSSEYDPDWLYNEYSLENGTEITYWDHVYSNESMNEVSERLKLTPPSDINYGKNPIVISFGREIVQIETTGEFYNTNAKLAFTFAEEYVENMAFFYQIQSTNVYPFDVDYYIMRGKKRTFWSSGGNAIYTIDKSAPDYSPGI